MKSKCGKPVKIDKELREYLARLADFEWKQLESYRSQIAKYPIDSPYRKFLEQLDSFSKRAQVESDFVQKRIDLIFEFNDLESLAKDGNVLGLRTLAFVATEATKRLNTWAKNHPEYVAVVAETMPLWPILVTRKSARDANLKTLLDSINLDEATPLGVPGAKIGAAPVEAKMWALALLQAIQDARSLQVVEELKRSSWGFKSYHTESLKLILELPVLERDKLLGQVKKLAPLGPGTKSDWWLLAKKTLRLTMEHRPELVKALISVYAQTERIKDMTSGDKSTIGIKESEAIEEVRKAFDRLVKQVSP